MSRRIVVRLTGGLIVGAAAWARRADAVPPAAERAEYGDGPSQWGELYRADGPTRGTVVVIHGGFWRARYGADLGAPLAADLAARGWTAWNIEYRRVGNGGGWPTTLTDVAAAIDHLAVLGERFGPDVVDLRRVVTLGHSAGGHLAVWAAGRGRLEPASPGAQPRVAVTGAVSQAGVLDLVDGVDLGTGAVTELLGGTPTEVSERYAVSDPMARLPLDVPVRCVHGRSDTVVPIRQSERYVAAASAAGADARLTPVDGDHMDVIDVGTSAWSTVLTTVDELTT